MILKELLVKNLFQCEKRNKWKTKEVCGGGAVSGLLQWRGITVRSQGGAEVWQRGQVGLLNVIIFFSTTGTEKVCGRKQLFLSDWCWKVKTD